MGLIPWWLNEREGDFVFYIDRNRSVEDWMHVNLFSGTSQEEYGIMHEQALRVLQSYNHPRLARRANDYQAP